MCEGACVIVCTLSDTPPEPHQPRSARNCNFFSGQQIIRVPPVPCLTWLTSPGPQPWLPPLLLLSDPRPSSSYPLPPPPMPLPCLLPCPIPTWRRATAALPCVLHTSQVLPARTSKAPSSPAYPPSVVCTSVSNTIWELYLQLQHSHAPNSLNHPSFT